MKYAAAALCLSLLAFVGGAPFLPISVAAAETDDPAGKYEPQELSGHSITVIDGDTVRVWGDARSIRLVGFNSPEVFSPQCDREKQTARQATERLQQLLLNAQTVVYERVSCACPPGTEGTDACNYGRICGTLRVDGVDVGLILISERLAVPFKCGLHSCPPTPGDWCG